MREVFFLMVFQFVAIVLGAQEAATSGVDTTDIRYKIGYRIGEWLPFLILLTLVILVMARASRLNRRE